MQTKAIFVSPWSAVVCAFAVYAATALIAAGSGWAAERKSLSRNWRSPFCRTFASGCALLAGAAAGRRAFAAIVVMGGALGAAAVLSALRKSQASRAARAASAAAYLAIAAAAVFFAWFAPAAIGVLVWVTVFAFDGFAGAEIPRLKRHLVAPETGAAHTWEGCAAGLLLALAAAMTLMPLTRLGALQSMVDVCFIIFAALLGELLAALARRKSGVDGRYAAIDRLVGFLSAAAACLAVGIAARWLMARVLVR